MILSKNVAVAIKPLSELNFDTTNRFTLVSQNAAGLAEMNRFLTKHNFDKTLTCSSTRI
jgi:DNA polymerase-3 subunit alpha/error-prone DNA polymerase